MKTHTPDGGFTMVELLAATVAASVLALTSGSLLVFGYGAWQNNRVFVEMQRDGAFAVELVERAVREAAPAAVSVSTGRLDVGIEAFYATNGIDLVYDPDTGAAGNEMVLAEGTLSRFAPALHAGSGVELELELRVGKESTAVTKMVAFRRSP